MTYDAETVKALDGSEVTRREFNRDYDVCAWCTDVLEFGDSKFYPLENVHGGVCHHCHSLPDVQHYLGC